jgi:NADPH:quinone reductase-like Zn-dependent oxidoreductase
VPVASQTAWQGIFTHGHLEKGQTILIHGAAGAVGAHAVQLASHAGGTVLATASGDDEEYLNSIGASLVIDYREAQFENVLREKIDVVFNYPRRYTDAVVPRLERKAAISCLPYSPYRKKRPRCTVCGA